MGKTIEKAKLWNIFDRERIKRGETSPIKVEAQIDNGATVAAILPKTIAEELSLPIIR